MIKLSPLKSGVVSFGSTKVTVAPNKKVFIHRVKAEMAWNKRIQVSLSSQCLWLRNKRAVMKGVGMTKHSVKSTFQRAYGL